MNYIILLIITLLLNIPCGYWRGGTKKFSWQWLLAIHLPIPIIFLFRYFLDEPHSWLKTPWILLVYFIGQWLGKWLRGYRKMAKTKNF